MSDIEDYAYSPYDDLEDILWDADPTPELADDLAEHAVHSPVYQEEDAVKNEMSEYYSDWEYYSDDYMDDDPTLLRKTLQAGDPAKHISAAAHGSRRGKKRKLIETIDIPPSGLDEVKLLTGGIKGTIWAKPSGQKTPAYKDGQEEKVALMKNWKDIFAIKDSGWTQSQGQAAEDESWANDMSLADMGLRHVQRQPSHDPTTQDAGAEIEEDDDFAESIAEGALEEEHDGQIIISKEGPGSNSIDSRHAVVGKEDDEGGGRSSHGVLDEDEIPRKKRRVKADPPSPPDSSEIVVVDAHENEVMSKAAAYHKKDGQDKERTSLVNGTGMSRVQPPDIHEPGSRSENKRKASEELDEVDLTASTASRAKRFASKAARNSQKVATTARSTH
ncbi:uncharacterized protein Z520_07377 [Fonsecaea multimorphosa CBS 102226]|uniref:Uncharacterized protein n=1 Tax=Fonsecaea multimorphosa CBS 102226 TaxID=1442371 RepID=A0A0D2KJ66_9EURO|nr:uncharacterized protein Z520_07377 [Fonsecaea multimorphosa CBS 102226]KIX96658.1 hypothetical protein Z520_07377 [Fonsecaea multimorphosa CBS 102226]OAL20740.1 hypothetical protein AYO22_08749 [Fonsecaea multimorphosa]